MNKINTLKKTKKILILGVGSAQCDAIHYCKGIGYGVYAISYKNEGRGVELSDNFTTIDIKDKKEVLEYAKRISGEG